MSTILRSEGQPASNSKYRKAHGYDCVQILALGIDQEARLPARNQTACTHDSHSSPLGFSSAIRSSCYRHT